MIYLVLLLAITSTALFALGITYLVAGEGQVVKRRLAAARPVKPGYQRIRQRRRRQDRRESIQELLEALGDRMESERSRSPALKKRLIVAGYRSPKAVSIYLGIRTVLAALFGVAAIIGGAVLQFPASKMMLLLFAGALLGWTVPLIHVVRRKRGRQREIQRHLPDVLDLLIVCVEAGMGLNQALARVSDEMDEVSPVMSEELSTVGLEMRAGTPREEALRHLSDRTDLSDVRSLVSMLIQTDRFGTSIADALRVHSDTLRSIRRQRAEEAAAKTTIKMLFPLVFFIFPAIFVVVLGPAAIHLIDMFANLQ